MCKLNLKKSSEFFDIPAADPETARRRRLPNILLAIFGAGNVLALIVVLVIPTHVIDRPRRADSRP